MSPRTPIGHDLLGGEDSRTAADLLVGTGLATAVPTVATGYADWADTEPGNDAVRRIGIVHAAFNATAVGLFAAFRDECRLDRLLAYRDDTRECRPGSRPSPTQTQLTFEVAMRIRSRALHRTSDTGVTWQRSRRSAWSAPG